MWYWWWVSDLAVSLLEGDSHLRQLAQRARPVAVHESPVRGFLMA